MEETEKESSLDKAAAEDAQRSLVLECAMQAGNILLQNGAEIFRVEETITRMCRHYGVESESAFILSNGILLRPEMKKNLYMRRCVIFLYGEPSWTG